jgi:hypothetical protein
MKMGLKIVTDVLEYDEHGFLPACIEFTVEEEGCKTRSGSIQLIDCLFKTQIGCEFYTDWEFTDEEETDVINECEDFAIDFLNQYKYKKTLFNCAIADVTADIYYNSREVFLVAVENGLSEHAYRKKYNVIKRFDSLEECETYLQNFYTDEFHDFTGLSRLLDDR